MAENILIKITAQSELEQANNELQQLADRERDIQMEMRKQQAEYGKQVANIQATVKGREAQIAALDKLRNAQTKQQAGLETELKKTKATLADFTEKMGAVNDAVADGAVKTPRLKAQLAALKEELSRLEIEGDNTSKTFIDLQKNANDTDRVLALARERYLKQMQEGNADEAKKTKEQIDTLLKLRDDAQKAKRDTENRYVIEDAAAQVSALNAAKVARIATMKDGRAKELAELRAGYAEKFKAITGNSEEEMALRTALIKQQMKEEGDINKRWRNKDIQDTVTQNAIKVNILLEADKGNVALKENAARANAAVEIASVRASEDRATLKAAKIKQIETKLAADLKLLEYEKTNSLAALTIQRDRNALQALTNSGEKESERRDELSAKILEDQARIDIAAVRQSVASAESKAEQIRGIELKLAGDKKAIEDSALVRLMNAAKDSNSRYLANERMTANMILASEESTGQQKQAARQRLRLLETMGLNDAEDDIQQRYAEGLVDKQAFEAAMFDIGQQRRQRELDDIKMKAEAEKAVREKLFEIGSTIVTSLFEAKRTSLDQEKSDLEQFYTTDANAVRPVYRVVATCHNRNAVKADHVMC